MDEQPDSDEMELAEIEAAYLRAMEATDSIEVLPTSVESEPEWIEIEEDSPLPLHDDSAAAQKADYEAEVEVEAPVTQPMQVVEALLFVGSAPLPAKKILDVLGGTTTHEQVDLLIEQLNNSYLSQNRPYEIRLVEGGYQMMLKSGYEPVRRRVYGQGPKDVKLNQETLEVLAFVAYKQPATRTDVESTGKKNPGALLRQLLRRQLISLERDPESSEEVYRTTKRFLDLFGLGSIRDLPQAVDFNFK